MASEIRGSHVYGSSLKPKISDLLLTGQEESTKTISLQWLFVKNSASMRRKLSDICQWNSAGMQPTQWLVARAFPPIPSKTKSSRP